MLAHNSFVERVNGTTNINRRLRRVARLNRSRERKTLAVISSPRSLSTLSRSIAIIMFSTYSSERASARPTLVKRDDRLTARKMTIILGQFSQIERRKPPPREESDNGGIDTGEGDALLGNCLRWKDT